MLGHNDFYGALGDGTTTASLVPVTVSDITNAVAIAAGEEYACSLLYGGTVRCWGSNIYGNLGNGTMTNSLVPVTVSGITNPVAIAAAEVHTCAVLNDGTVLCWALTTRASSATAPRRTVPFPSWYLVSPTPSLLASVRIPAPC